MLDMMLINSGGARRYREYSAGEHLSEEEALRGIDECRRKMSSLIGLALRATKKTPCVRGYRIERVATAIVAINGRHFTFESGSYPVAAFKYSY